ncbi:MAG: hypothetical protein WDM80_06640 [Limisphaerales bacterium]
MTDDMFSGKAATKAATALREKLLPNPKGRLQEQFHEVAAVQAFVLADGAIVLGMGAAVFEVSPGSRGRLAASQGLGSTGVTPFLTELAVQGGWPSPRRIRR